MERIPENHDLAELGTKEYGSVQKRIGTSSSRRAFLTFLAALALSGCRPNSGCDDAPRAPAPSPPPAKPPAQEPSRGPDFLYEDTMELHGLPLLLMNSGEFDKYIFNAVTGNHRFHRRLYIQKGYQMDFEGGRHFEMPYHGLIFNAFDERSNLRLPKRLGKAVYGTSLADFFNTVSRYGAKHTAEIKEIIRVSFELSFGIRLNPVYIQIVPKKDGSIATIKYIGASPENLVGETIIALSTGEDPANRESQLITGEFETKREKAQALLDFIHTFNYYPDAFGETPKAPMVSLISRGGDCEDSTILFVSLARAIGLDAIILYLDKHVLPAVDVEGSGTAVRWGGKNYEWTETTGEVIIRTLDPYTGQVISTERRAHLVGEESGNGPERGSVGLIIWAQRVGGPLVPMRE